MPRETVEEVFRRVQSEARQEARIELQRDLERRRQRKLEYRKKREQEAQFHCDETLRLPAPIEPSMTNRSRAILAKPKKKVLSSLQSSANLVGGNTPAAPADCILSAIGTPPRRDVSTATDPFYTKYPTRSRFEEITAVESQDQFAADDRVSGQKQDNYSTHDMELKEEGCEAKPGNCVSEANAGMAEWEKAWYQLAVEEIDDDKEVSLVAIDGAAWSSF